MIRSFVHIIGLLGLLGLLGDVSAGRRGRPTPAPPRRHMPFDICSGLRGSARGHSNHSSHSNDLYII